VVQKTTPLLYFQINSTNIDQHQQFLAETNGAGVWFLNNSVDIQLFMMHRDNTQHNKLQACKQASSSSSSSSSVAKPQRGVIRDGGGLWGLNSLPPSWDLSRTGEKFLCNPLLIPSP